MHLLNCHFCVGLPNELDKTTILATWDLDLMNDIFSTDSCDAQKCTHIVNVPEGGKKRPQSFFRDQRGQPSNEHRGVVRIRGSQLLAIRTHDIAKDGTSLHMVLQGFLCELIALCSGVRKEAADLLLVIWAEVQMCKFARIVVRVLLRELSKEVGRDHIRTIRIGVICAKA